MILTEAFDVLRKFKVRAKEALEGGCWVVPLSDEEWQEVINAITVILGERGKKLLFG